MKIKDIINKVKFIYPEIRDDETIIKLYNLVILDLTSYFPLIEEEYFDLKEVKYNKFKKRVRAIIDCQNSKYKVYPQCVKSMNKQPLGKIKYHYIPATPTSIEDECEYNKSFLQIIVFGICAEYCITIADFDNAVLWHQRQTRLCDSREEAVKIWNRRGASNENIDNI